MESPKQSKSEWLQPSRDEASTNFAVLGMAEYSKDGDPRISYKLLIINMFYLFADAEGKNTSRYGINVNIHAGSSVLFEAACASWRLPGD